MTDLTTLSEVELNIRVAKLLGYTVKGENDDWTPYDPTGRILDDGLGHYGSHTEEYAWNRISSAMRWAQLIDAAIPLLVEIPGGDMLVEHNQWLVSADGLNPQSSEEGDLSNEALARCIVLLWLEWKEREGKP